MLEKMLKEIDAVLPIRPPDVKNEYLKINVKLDNLSVFVGPNASGKTTILQTVGFLLSGLLNPTNSSLSIALTKTLRPKMKIPESMIGTAILNGTKIYGSIVTPHKFIPIMENSFDEIKNIAKILNIKYNILLDEIKKDVKKYEEILIKLEIEENEQEEIPYIVRRNKIYKLIKEFTSSILGKYIDMSISDPFWGIKSSTKNISIPRYIFRIRNEENIKIFYNFTENLIEKMIVINAMGSTIIFKRKNPTISEKEISVVVFHPGFIFSLGKFEGLYSFYVNRGLPQEDEALKLLQKYIPWVRGYELIGHELYLKSNDGRRISIYNLSDGYRVAIFMSLLYALFREKMVFLIDTPEAFVHPDGLPIIADFISRLVANGNQVLVATQSIEFLRRLLLSSKENRVLNNTIVERINLDNNGIIKPTGIWDGRTSLNSIDTLGLDLRK